MKLLNVLLLLLLFSPCEKVLAVNSGLGNPGPWAFDEWVTTPEYRSLSKEWFAINFPSHYEFYTDGAVGKDLAKLQIAGYSKIFGLEGDWYFNRVSNDNNLNLKFNTRILGVLNKSTNFTIFGGVKLQKKKEQVYFIGPSLTLYLSKYFGFLGEYTYNLNQEKEYFVDLFLEFKFFRPYIEYYNRNKTKGYNGGARIYF